MAGGNFRAYLTPEIEMVDLAICNALLQESGRSSVEDSSENGEINW